MTKLDIELKESDYKRLEKTAKRGGKSVQALIYEWIAQLPDIDEAYDVTKDPIFQMEGYESKAPANLSADLDKYLYSEEYPK